MTDPATPSSATPEPDLRIVSTRIYRGPNVWSYLPSIHLVVDLGTLEQFPSNTIDGFVDGLLDLLPGLREHTCSRGHAGGFVERLREGTWAGHVAEHVALQLQQEAGHDLRRGKTRQVKGVPGRYNVVYAYNDERVGVAAGELAVRVVNELVRPTAGFSFEAELDSFLLAAVRTAFGPSTQAIVEEAMSRDIPWIRLNEYSLVQLGQGVHQKRIRATMTSRDLGHRGRHRQRQGADPPAAFPSRVAGSPVRSHPHRRRRRRAGTADRLPGGDKTPGREPRSRGDPRPA